MTYRIVVLNRYPELLRPLLDSLERFCPNERDPIVVADRYPADAQLSDKAEYIRSPHESFCYARNANIGIRHASPNDVILCNDDTSVIESDFFGKLAGIASHIENIGILGPMIEGGIGNALQDKSRIDYFWHTCIPPVIELNDTSSESLPVCFVCAFISRKAIDSVGLLDEDFTGYGFDDNDYNIRCRKARFVTAITTDCTLRHGSGGKGLYYGQNWSSSFARDHIDDNTDIFYRKYPRNFKMAQTF